MKTKTQSILGNLILMISLIVLLNLISSYQYLRLDFSRGKIYTLGKVSKAAVKALEDNMIVKVYASPELPAEYRSMDRYLKDLLSEYSLYSKNRFRFEYVNNKNKEEFRSLAMANQLNYSVVPTYENDQMAFKEVVYGITFEYENRRETLNLRTNIESKLEYEISTIIRTLNQVKLPTVAIFRDSTYFYLRTDAFEKALTRNFNVFETDLNFLPSSVSVLLFTGVADSLSQNQLFQLDQYLMRGGKMVVLQESVPLWSEPLFDINSNFIELLEHYGIKIHPNLVMDIVCDIQRMGIYDRVPYPIFPVARGTDNPITKDMNNIVMYLTSQLSASSDSIKSTFEPLLSTSHNSLVVSGPTYNLETFIMRSPTPELFPMPPQTVGARLKGEFNSYFADKPRPDSVDFVSSVKNGEIIVFADRELVVDIDNPLFQNRWFIILNAIDHFLDNKSMIQIRSRSIQSSFLNVKVFLSRFKDDFVDINELELKIKLIIRIFCIALPSLLLFLMGLYIWVRNKNYRRRIAEIYEKA